MFNANFYPTPDELIEQLYQPYTKREYPYILEPSAGKGNILDYLTKRYDGGNWRSSGNVRKSHLYAIEMEPELQDTLRGKGYPVVADDFLTFDDPMHIDLIIMNPPFSQGAKHLLKAWDVVTDGGSVACILNAETIRNPYTEERKLLSRIIDMHGCVELAGRPFGSAERPTDVECVIVRLDKPARERTDFGGIGVKLDSAESEEAFSASPLASANILEALVNQYQCASKLLIEHRKLSQQYAFYTSGITQGSSESLISPKDGLNEDLAKLKGYFWRYIFDKTKLGTRVTSKFRQDFQTFVAQQSNMAFTIDNIMAVLEMFFLNQENMMQQCIEHVFDTATALHEKNQIHSEGWKTNKSWKIAPKVILPYGIRHDGTPWAPWSTHYNNMDIYKDFDRALCFVTGRKIEDIWQAAEAIEQRVRDLNSNKQADHTDVFESTFFDIRIFKKGTVHLVFKDRDVLAKFNQAAAKQKNWVGGGY